MQEPTKKNSLNPGNDTVVADEGLAVVWVVMALDSRQNLVDLKTMTANEFGLREHLVAGLR